MEKTLLRTLLNHHASVYTSMKGDPPARSGMRTLTHTPKGRRIVASCHPTPWRSPFNPSALILGENKRRPDPSFALGDIKYLSVPILFLLLTIDVVPQTGVVYAGGSLIAGLASNYTSDARSGEIQHSASHFAVFYLQSPRRDSYIY